MSASRWAIVVVLVLLFIFAKGWVLKHPKGIASAIIGAFLLTFSESAEAN